ncbi:hypothetical protein [Paenibacillus sp. 1P03SA]|uniref:hypothetical protein n=1 Tax=Paenibacillus sp. 1P03SA TaxID=3132294 RepID=UPI0039A160C2
MKKSDALIESKVLRETVADRVEVLEKVKKLIMLPDDLHSSIDMALEYFEVKKEALKSCIKDHRLELESDGLRVLAGDELRSLKDLGVTGKNTVSFTIIPRRALLRIGMLLRDSAVAQKIRDYLLEVEGGTRPKNNDLELKRKNIEVKLLNAKVRQSNTALKIAEKVSMLGVSQESLVQLYSFAANVLTDRVMLPPPEVDKTYTATEIGNELGLSSNKIGRLANEHNLKTAEYGITVLDKSRSSDKQVPSFRYNEAGRKKLIELVSQKQA